MTPKQRSKLKKLAHHLKPVHHIGKDGVTPSSTAPIMDAFSNRELIKVKVQDSAGLDVKSAAAQVAEMLPEVELVQTIGHVMVLYRRHPEKPEISLD